jgi:hypothetical protein
MPTDAVYCWTPLRRGNIDYEPFVLDRPTRVRIGGASSRARVIVSHLSAAGARRTGCMDSVGCVPAVAARAAMATAALILGFGSKGTIIPLLKLVVSELESPIRSPGT